MLKWVCATLAGLAASQGAWVYMSVWVAGAVFFWRYDAKEEREYQKNMRIAAKIAYEQMMRERDAE